ncbi:hypothetical protein D0Y65_051612 [Glycine soja]|uniref:Uncharacterized protein n=1 Tax=Glycine soja TaxID=3848 RepID=A0A445FH60_GLYSO|nr:hypothetical protein D0Y65_051612 [Glycine soja]
MLVSSPNSLSFVTITLRISANDFRDTLLLPTTILMHPRPFTFNGVRTRVAVLGREALYSINHLKKFWFISQPGMKNMFILDSIQIMNANVFFGHIKF